MSLCPTCGNKRCPGAANHENPCSGSNDPGQPGSLFEGIVYGREGIFNDDGSLNIVWNNPA